MKKPTSTKLTAKKPRAPKQLAGAAVEPPPTQQQSASPPRTDSRAATLMALLARPDGATIDELVTASGWLPHSVRGFLAGTLKKRYGVAVTSEKRDGIRVYHCDGGAQC